MRTTRSPDPPPRLTIGRIMIAIAALAVLLWLAAYHTPAFFLLAFAGLQVGTYFLTRPAEPREARPPKARSGHRFQFSIRQVMVAAAVVAVFSAVVRAIVFGLESAAPAGFPRQGPTWAIILWVVASLLVGLGLLSYVGWYLIAISRAGLRARPRGDIMFGLSRKERWPRSSRDRSRPSGRGSWPGTCRSTRDSRSWTRPSCAG